MKKGIVLLAASLCLTGVAAAQTVTVDANEASPDNVSTFDSLAVAISSFQASGPVTAATDGAGLGVNNGDGAANVINITSTAKLEEVLQLDENTADQDEALTINGPGATSGHVTPSAADNAVVAPQDSGDGDGFWIESDQDITINNVTFIPASASAATDDLLYIRDANDGLNTYTFAGCVLTFPDTGGAPVVNSKADAMTDLTANIDDTNDGDDFVNVGAGETQALTVEFVDSVLSHGKSTGDGIVEVAGSASSADHASSTRTAVFTLRLESSIISYCGRYGLQFAGNGDSSATNGWQFVATGSNIGDGPVDALGGPTIVYAARTNHNVICFLGPAVGYGNIDNFLTAGGITRAWSGDSDFQEVSVTDSLYMQLDEDSGGGTTELCYVQDGWEGQVAHSFERVTLFGPNLWGDPINTGTGPTNTFRNCIFAGNGFNPLGTLFTGDYNLDFDFGAIVENGPYAAEAGYTPNSGYTPGGDVITDDPEFVSIDPLSSDFLDVGASTYGAAGPSGVPLEGGADYVGSSVGDWYRY